MLHFSVQPHSASFKTDKQLMAAKIGQFAFGVEYGGKIYHILERRKADIRRALKKI